MIPVQVEGVRRNFTVSSAFLYSVSLVDEARQRLLVFGIERHEAIPIVAALSNLTLPRPEAINVMSETLRSLSYVLEEVGIEHHSMLPLAYNLCQCRLSFRAGEDRQEQRRIIRPGDVVGLALLMHAPIFVSDEVFAEIGVPLEPGRTPELVFARYLLKQEGIPVPEGTELRLGYGKTPLRDALVDEFKAALLGKAPAFPEESMDQRKQDYLTFLLRQDTP
jgi:bifunctional DNase/RNase